MTSQGQLQLSRCQVPDFDHTISCARREPLVSRSTATLRTQPKCPEITRTSFHGAWYVGFIVRVVLWRVRACESALEDEKVEGWVMGLLSILAIIRDVSVSADARRRSVQ